MSNQLKEYFTENLDMLNDAKALTSYMNSGEFFEEMVGDKVVNIAKEIAAEFPKNKSLVELNEKHLENWKSYNSKKSNKIINLKFKALEYFTLSYKPHSAIGYSDFKFGLRWKNESLKLQEESSLISILSDVFSLEKNHIKLEEGYLILKKPLEDFSNLEDSKSIKAIENGDFKKKLKTHLEKMFALALEVEKQIKLKKL